MSEQRATGAGATTRSGTAWPLAVPWWLPLAAVGVVGAVAGYLVKVPCRFGGGWSGEAQYTYACYSDIFPLYYRDDLDAGTLPYLDQPVEYPVLIGGLMTLAARLVSGLPDPVTRGLAYFDATAAVLGACLVVAVVATGYLAGRGGVEPAGPDSPARFDRSAAWWAGLVVALAPAAVLTAYINWDLLAVAPAVLALACYARGRAWPAGVLLGVAVAAKFYPVVLLGPILCLALRDTVREGRVPREPLRLFGGAAATWAVVNLPVYLATPEGWATFFTFSRERGVDWGSLYYVLGDLGVPGVPEGDAVNTAGTVAFAVCCAGIALLAWLAPRRPDAAPLLFLVVAAFLLTNKVWSPQFVLWLLPVAVLAVACARSRWPMVIPLLCWQLAELGYVLGIWAYLLRVLGDGDVGIGFGAYAALTLARAAGLLLLCAFVVVDTLRTGDRCPRRLVA